MTKKRDGDRFADIKAACPPEAHDLKTAEGRANWDDELREKIKELAGSDKPLWSHLGQMVKTWRRDVLYEVDRGIFKHVEREIFSMGDANTRTVKDD